jgi:hypothetical protein
MGKRNIKKFSSFVSEEFPPPIVPPTNVASGANIAGLSPDLPPVPTAAQRKKSKILKRKPPHT